jgi:hypothetical protein
LICRICAGCWGCGRLGGWRSGRLCATRGQTDIRGFGPQDHVRRGEPLSRIGRGPASRRVAHSWVAGSPRVAGPPPTQPTGLADVGCRVHSIWVIAQQNPASSRAAATAMIVRRLARRSSLVQVRCSRCWADQAIAIASGGWLACRSVRALPIRGRGRASARPPRRAAAGRGRSRSW